MLVLQRNVGEEIVITVPPSTTPTVITVQLSDIRSKRQARLGFEAHTKVRIMRSELESVAQVSSDDD